MGCSYVITAVAKGKAEVTNSFLLAGTTEEDKRFEDETTAVEDRYAQAVPARNFALQFLEGAYHRQTQQTRRSCSFFLGSLPLASANAEQVKEIPMKRISPALFLDYRLPSPAPPLSPRKTPVTPPKVIQIVREFLKAGKAGAAHDRSEAASVSLSGRQAARPLCRAEFHVRASPSALSLQVSVVGGHGKR